MQNKKSKKRKIANIRTFIVVPISLAFFTIALIIMFNSLIVRNSDDDYSTDIEITAMTAEENITPILSEHATNFQRQWDEAYDVENITPALSEENTLSDYSHMYDQGTDSTLDNFSESTIQQDSRETDRSEEAAPPEARENYLLEQNSSMDEAIMQRTGDEGGSPNMDGWYDRMTGLIRCISELGLTYEPSVADRAADSEVRFIMLHHTYGLFDSDDSLRGMHNDHKTRAGLDGGGIAYSEIIQTDGTVWIARGEKATSHTGISEDDCIHSYSITVSGNFDEVGRVMSEAQYNSLESRLAAAMRQFPNATIIGHSDLAPTACPGQSFPWDRLEENIGAVRGAPRGRNIIGQ